LGALPMGAEIGGEHHGSDPIKLWCTGTEITLGEVPPAISLCHSIIASQDRFQGVRGSESSMHVTHRTKSQVKRGAENRADTIYLPGKSNTTFTFEPGIQATPFFDGILFYALRTYVKRDHEHYGSDPDPQSFTGARETVRQWHVFFLNQKVVRFCCVR
jgi:hypothetical protein